MTFYFICALFGLVIAPLLAIHAFTSDQKEQEERLSRESYAIRHKNEGY